MIYRIIIGIVTYLFINIPADVNADIAEYKSDYYGDGNRFEYGYGLLQSFFISFNLNFETFWMFLLIIQSVFISMIYGPLHFFLNIPSFEFYAGYLLGTQVRYSIAALCFLVGMSVTRYWKLIFFIVAVSFHYAACIMLAMWVLSIACINMSKNKLIFYSFVSAFCVYMLSFKIIDIIVSFTVYEYYVGTDFFEPKSFSSILYMAASLTIAAYIVKRTNHYYLNDFFRIYFIALLTALAFSSFAVVSGDRKSVV